ncbi:ABC transporter substrate-binding protein [Streptomyces sp. NBC_00006]|uniref:ABC transporter substrate-binding protein n=1 Tax=Streptomyces sp. NBC_00006 TaxID=2975619 RepID=UPI00225970BF|nr:ABC transporter substrate-binding protein [Streptomyces sp. NBC_00006]MCX5534615.1 ABC transporter substrate-binding protein [Streptomyces sp. NBC_00006]
MRMRNQWLVMPLGAGLAAALLTGCGSDESDSADDGNAVVMGMSDDIQATDPASGYDPGSWLLFNNVFQSLLSFPKGGTEPQPEAAKECHFSDSATKVYTCTLRSGLKFSNGHALTSKDVKFSFDRMMRINDEAGPAIMFPMLDKVETPDARTVTFKLKSADATFPSKIASGAGSIVDHTAYPADKLRNDGKAVGSGPYKLDSFGKKQADFSVNAKYEGTAKVKNQGVTMKFFHGDQAGLKKSLLAGNLDLAYRGLAAKDVADIEKSGTKNLDVIEGTSAEVQHLVFNMDDPVAGKIGVRKAMAYLIDRDALIDDVYDQTATSLYSIIPAGITGHNTAFFDKYGARPSKSRAAAALRADGVNTPVKLTLWSTPARYGPATDAELKTIAKQLNASGLFDADVKSVEFAQYERDIKSGKYGVYVKGWVPDYPDPDNFTQPFFGKGNVLDNRYDNSTITGRIIPETGAQSDRSGTVPRYEQLQNIVADQLPILPVWQAKQYAVAKSDVYGLENCLDASTVFRFWEISKG